MQIGRTVLARGVALGLLARDQLVEHLDSGVEIDGCCGLGSGGEAGAAAAVRNGDNESGVLLLDMNVIDLVAGTVAVVQRECFRSRHEFIPFVDRASRTRPDVERSNATARHNFTGDPRQIRVLARTQHSRISSPFPTAIHFHTRAIAAR